MANKEDLIADLESDGNEYFDAGRMNNLIDLGLSIVAILASLTAGVLVGAAWRDAQAIIAGVAAIPAACVSIQAVLDVRGRSDWYFLHAARVRALALKLKYEDAPNLAEVARERAELELEMESRWAKIGRSRVNPPGQKVKNLINQGGSTHPDNDWCQIY
jgi:hypothetical protein